MVSPLPSNDLIALLNALEERLGSSEEIRIDSAAMSIVETAIAEIVAIIQQSNPPAGPEEQQVALLKALLLWAWQHRPSADELDGYWFLRGIVYHFCLEHTVVEDQMLGHVLSFIHTDLLQDTD